MGLGVRVGDGIAGATATFLYDGGRILLEKQGGTTTGTYTYGNALARKDGEVPLFDGPGLARSETNGSGGVTATLTLAVFPRWFHVLIDFRLCQDRSL